MIDSSYVTYQFENDDYISKIKFIFWDTEGLTFLFLEATQY
jgi:hypothetical protein